MWAIGLVVAFVGGLLTSRVLAGYRAMYGAQDGAKAVTGLMRAARLRWLIWVAIIFAIGWLWIHGNL